MAHVLIDGSPRQLAVIRTALDPWGVTTAPLEGGAAAGRHPTVQECDVLLRFENGGGADGRRFRVEPEDAGPIPVTGPPPAPLMLITVAPETGGAWVVMTPCEAQGRPLLEAVRSCRVRARALRRGAVSHRPAEPVQERLSHELRTPLTAIKTALELLETVEQLDEDARRMVAIAQHNVARLEETVEWGEDLLAADSPEPLPIA